MMRHEQPNEGDELSARAETSGMLFWAGLTACIEEKPHPQLLECLQLGIDALWLTQQRDLRAWPMHSPRDVASQLYLGSGGPN
jgi:hypothetical protein